MKNVYKIIDYVDILNPKKKLTEKDLKRIREMEKMFRKFIEDNEIKISMDGRGRCMDNIFTERLWRTIKYENVYLNDYQNFNEAETGLKNYFKFYNEKRRHQSLDYKTPAEVYFK